MASPTQPEPLPVNILVLDEEGPSALALRQVLDSEGWRVRFTADAKHLLTELRVGVWSLVIANVDMIDIDSPGFLMLRELASVPVEDGGRIRCLFLVPEMTGSQFVRQLEQVKLPYVIRPYHLHDFLEKVSDLLVEVKAIDAPLRQVRYEFGGLRKKKRQAARTNSMFASRDSYSYSEEELAEYEKQESELNRNKRQKPLGNLGDPNR
jgi:Response regulator containing a CheY-like receiver domain and a GGDEF domain